VLRFGRWLDTTEPGLHYHLPYRSRPLLLPKVTQINQLQLGGAALRPTPPTRATEQMLTGDENIVEAIAPCFGGIKDARHFYSRSAVELSVKIAAESALRRSSVARDPVGDVRQAGANRRWKPGTFLQRLLASGARRHLITSALQRVDPPRQVIDAFNDVQRARADQERARQSRRRPIPMMCCARSCGCRPDRTGSECLQGPGGQPSRGEATTFCPLTRAMPNRRR